MKRHDRLLFRFLLILAIGACPSVLGSDKGRQDSLVFVEVSPTSLSGLRPERTATLRSDVCSGAHLVRWNPTGEKKVLSAGFESACEPDVSFDARHILFAGRRHAGDAWNIFEIDVDGRNLRQITREAGNCRQPRYLSNYYVITADEPWLQILFVSDAAGELNEKGDCPATDLYSCRIDGSEIRRVTYNPSADLDPFLMWDGRILFSSWQSSLPRFGSRGRMRIFAMNVDGTDLTAFTAEQGLRVQRMPAVTSEGLAVFVESNETVPDGGGQLGRVELRRNLHSYRSLTGPSDGLFHTPSPLPDGSLLVSWRANNASQPYALFRFDPETSKLEPLYSDPSRHLLQGHVLRPRPRPDGRSSVVNDAHPYGQFYALNIGINDLTDPSWLAPPTARRIRVIEGLPRHVSDPPPSVGSPYLPGRILGKLRSTKTDRSSSRFRPICRFSSNCWIRAEWPCAAAAGSGYATRNPAGVSDVTRTASARLPIVSSKPSRRPRCDSRFPHRRDVSWISTGTSFRSSPPAVQRKPVTETNRTGST